MNFFEKLFFKSIDRKLDLILSKEDAIMTKVADLPQELGTIKDALAASNASLEAIAADEQRILDKLNQIPPDDLSEDAQKALDEAKALATANRDRAAGIDANVPEDQP